ncbi:hypothetical protein HPB51_027705 [Rhipicephalus microplus]|uniref:Uncharacterized protein n=1 Tax=Rhipicephalus microplus TaxID=6941 RepID=A0A9J6CZ50_RHIMP|nr:hypothetical protein HPB51_027705 [Rhipicephalus microplus]
MRLGPASQGPVVTVRLETSSATRESTAAKGGGLPGGYVGVRAVQGCLMVEGRGRTEASRRPVFWHPAAPSASDPITTPAGAYAAGKKLLPVLFTSGTVVGVAGEALRRRSTSGAAPVISSRAFRQRAVPNDFRDGASRKDRANRHLLSSCEQMAAAPEERPCRRCATLLSGNTARFSLSRGHAYEGSAARAVRSCPGPQPSRLCGAVQSP